MREQRDILEDHPDPPSLGRDGHPGPGHPAAADLDRARIGGVEPGDQAQDRRLAAAGRPEHRQHLAGPHVEVDVVDRDDVAERAPQAARLDRVNGRAVGNVATRQRPGSSTRRRTATVPIDSAISNAAGAAARA